MSFNEYEKIVISALLHDIGKIVQRSKEEKEAKSKKHQEWGAEWIETNLKNLDKDILDSLINSALYHHYVPESDFKSEKLSISKGEQSKNWLNWLIYEADNLASGERGEKGDLYFQEEKWEKNYPLTSLFWKIRLTPESREEYKYKDIPWVYYPETIEKELKNIIYPHKFESEKLIPTHEYGNILKKFEDSIKTLIKIDKFESNYILPLIEKYFSFIPSETQITNNPYENPDISLYDHLRLTSAITLCLYIFLENKYGNKWKENPKQFVLQRNEKRFLLIGGDISGIQDFIYTITSKNALKSLRGRSFYLQILTEHVVHKFLDQLNLKDVCVIFKGGGSFLILAPNIKEVIEKINEIEKEINDFIFKKFKGKIYFAIDYEELSGKDLIIEKEKENDKMDITIRWQNLNKKLGEKKKKKFYNILKEEDFEPQKIGEKECEICKEEGEIIELEDIEVCPECFHLIKLGEKLKESRYLLLQKEGKDIYENDYFVKIENWTWYLYDKLPEKYEGELFLINEFREGYKTFWISNYSTQGGDFEKIVKSKNADGAPYLGVLKMDVDNLGKILFRGLPEELRTFSRIAALSRLIHLFFAGFINRIARGYIGELENKPLRLNKNKQDRQVNNENIEREVVIIYSGGDDLLIAGAWNDVLEISFDIKRSFKRYICENPDIGISGGFVVSHPDIPVYHLAEIVDKAESIAKSQEDKFGRKDSLCLFYSPYRKTINALKWEKWEEMIDNFIMNLLTLGQWEKGEFKPDFSTSFLYRLHRISKNVKEYGKFSIPYAFDTFKRIKKPEWEKHENRHKNYSFEKLKQFSLNLENLENLIYPLEWVILFLRKREV